MDHRWGSSVKKVPGTKKLGTKKLDGPELWLRMQMARDLWRLERTLRADLARIPTYGVA